MSFEKSRFLDVSPEVQSLPHLFQSAIFPKQKVVLQKRNGDPWLDQPRSYLENKCNSPFLLFFLGGFWVTFLGGPCRKAIAKMAARVLSSMRSLRSAQRCALSAEQLSAFDTDGFLTPVASVLSMADVTAARARLERLETRHNQSGAFYWRLPMCPNARDA